MVVEGHILEGMPIHLYAARVQVRGHLERNGARVPGPSLYGRWDEAMHAELPGGAQRLLWQKNPPPADPTRCAPRRVAADVPLAVHCMLPVSQLALAECKISFLVFGWCEVGPQEPLRLVPTPCAWNRQRDRDSCCGAPSVLIIPRSFTRSARPRRAELGCG
jgi:hypothetical protein